MTPNTARRLLKALDAIDYASAACEHYAEQAVNWLADKVTGAFSAVDALVHTQQERLQAYIRSAAVATAEQKALRVERAARLAIIAARRADMESDAAYNAVYDLRVEFLK